ncbi:acetyltransferase (GNAT) family protein [Methylobacterium sp. B4]|nr:acetyltransferase (GNAT) family protein [Methylobacterium sp. B4]
MIAPQLFRNRSGAHDIRAHLTACAASFTPPLDKRVAIPDYAAKLATSAERFEAWEGPTLIGLVAVYCNDPARARAFVTSVSVLPGRRRAGLGRGLIEAAIVHVRGLGFARLALCVDRSATAIGLYRRLGFIEEGAAGEAMQFSLDLGTP